MRIRTNSGAAIAQLSAVAMAVRRLQDAQGRENVAEARLAELRAKEGVSAVKMRAAEEALARARRATADATIRLAQAHNQNDQATQSETHSTDQANKSAGMLLTTLLALGPALIPIGAVGVGALAGVAAGAGTAMLAFLGLKQAWQTGALQGTAFEQLVGQMSDEFVTLKQTAAAGVLSGLTGAMQALTPMFGQVNGLVSVFAGDLGMIAQALAPALVQVVTQLTPVITTFGDVLVTGANKLAGWVQSSGGIQAFGNYVISELPAVLHTLGSLLELAGHLVAALAPLGTVVVQALGMVADVINRIPVNVLTGLVAAALAAYAAFKAWSLITTAITAVRAALEGFELTIGASLGVLGGLILLLGVFAFAMHSSSQSQADAQQIMQSYADSVQQSTNALNAANQAQILKNLSDKGALTTLDQLHAKGELMNVTYQDMVTAVAQGGPAMKDLLTEMGQLAQGGGKTAISMLNLMSILSQQSTGLHEQIAAYKSLNAAQVQQQAQLGASDAATAVYARTLGVTSQQYLTAAAAAENLKQQSQAQTTQYQLENDAASLLKQTLDLLSGKSMSLAQAQNTLDSALANMGTHVNATGKQIHFTTTSIMNMSSASVALRGQLIQQVQSAESVAEAYGNVKGSSEAARQKLITLRQEIINNAVAHGVDRQAVTNYVDSILSIPKSVPPTKLQIDKAQAEAAIQALRVELANLTSQRYTINVDQVVHGGYANVGVVGSGTTVKAQATGGPVDGPGSKGRDSLLRMLAPGEWVIRDQAVDALKARYGPNVMHMINSGRVPSVPVSAGAAPRAQQVGSPAMPSVLVVLDADGQLIGRMRVEAQSMLAHQVRQAVYG